jgi:hypothetical protein
MKTSFTEQFEGVVRFPSEKARNPLIPRTKLQERSFCLPSLIKNKVRTLQDDVYSIVMMNFLRSLAMTGSFHWLEACEARTMLCLKLERLVQPDDVLPDDLSSHSLIPLYSKTTYHEVSITRYVISGSSWEDEHATRKTANCRLTSKSFRFLFFFISKYTQDVKNANGKKVNIWWHETNERD